ncbi:thioredoxin peroxidase dot5 [Microbotryomycetes sp. JL221]|nr:thioredoxin peroxidase dot5 [Microbotryomycetes sp. JL221]
MPPKRKEETDSPADDANAQFRRSTRTTTTATSKANGDRAKSATKPASAGKAGAPKAPVSDAQKDKKQSDDKTDDAPAAKKPKTASKVLEQGDQVPDLTLKNEDDQDTSIASLYKDSGLVIFSYPKANTPGCTNQACGYRDIYDDIKAEGFNIAGLSQDKPKAQKSWQTSKNLQYTLLCDPDRTLLKQLGATEAKKRCHWVIEKGGMLLEAKIGVKPADDPKNALDFIKSTKK